MSVQRRTRRWRAAIGQQKKELPRIPVESGAMVISTAVFRLFEL